MPFLRVKSARCTSSSSYDPGDHLCGMVPVNDLPQSIDLFLSPTTPRPPSLGGEATFGLDTTKVCENSDGRASKQTIAKYFETTYRRLQFPTLPCLQVNPEKKRIFIPLEVCEIGGGDQHCKKNLDVKQNAEIIKFTTKPPKQRFDKVRGESLKTANFNQDPCVKEFGMKVSAEPLALEERVIEFQM
ncbi:protein argonaute-4 [Caerostris extrusa]|uniref:Protein argonaute-4 n=1 Tax=Caerostris extrusa TaxID=172846 RepID=A0AAV4P7L6_CAEEX|nr:protein argonaute-4 [Caerostris extrusa]